MFVCLYYVCMHVCLQVKLQLLSVPSLEVYYSLEISPASKLFHGDLTEVDHFHCAGTNWLRESVLFDEVLLEKK